MIIGLAGNKGSGKDTVADFLVQDHGFDRVAFADPVHKKVKFLLQLKDHNEYNQVKRTKLTWQDNKGDIHFIDGRHLIREIGMLMLSYNKDQFTQYVESRFFKMNGRVVVTDMRFDHEHFMLKRNNAIFCKVKRPGFVSDNHITEKGFNDSEMHFIVENDSSIKALRKKVNELVEKVEHVHTSRK